jgi:hypothetical protein
VILDENSHEKSNSQGHALEKEAGQPLPSALVTRLVKARVAENEAVLKA